MRITLSIRSKTHRRRTCQVNMLPLLSVTFFIILCASSSASILHLENNVCDHDMYYPLLYLDSTHCKKNPDVFSNVEAIIARHHFPLESYEYANSDGYIMTLHRIPSKNQSKPVIYLSPGITSCTACFVHMDVKSHAFFLSSLGYDVWMGNQRGVRDCKQHVYLSPNDPKFWSFNLDDIAAVDIRENLLFIANKTGKAGSIIFYGYSMGSTFSYMYVSRYPEEAQKLLMGLISLAPVAFLDGPQDLLRRTVGQPAAFLTKIFGIAAFLPNEKSFEKLEFGFCTAMPWACRLALRFIFGPSKQLASQDIQLFTTTCLGSASRNQVLQYLQILMSKKLQMFDFKRDNRKHYGQEQPPEYDLSKMTLPLFMFYGLNDVVATEKNVQRLYEKVGSQKKGMFRVPESDDAPAFNHLDFAFSKYMDTLLFPKLQQILSDEFQ